MKIEVEASAIGRLAEPAVWSAVQHLADNSGVERLVLDPGGFHSGSLGLAERFDDAT